MILFFCIYKIVNIRFAIYILISTTLLQISYLLIVKKKVSIIQWINLTLIILLGGTSLWLHNEALIKYKPTIIYFLLAGLLIVLEQQGKQPIQLILKKKINISNKSQYFLTISWSIFFLFLSTLNMIVAYYCSIDTWLTYKLFGNTGLIIIFTVLQGFFLFK